MTDRIFNFARLDQFLENFEPQSPMGRREKAEKKIYFKTDELLIRFKRIDILMDFIKEEGEKRDKIEYHLKRVPIVGKSFAKGELRSELHNIKKILHNYRSIRELLDTELIEEFSLFYNPDDLLSYLGYEEDQRESFFVNDSFSPELKKTRSELRKINDKLNIIKEHRINQIRETYSFDFRFNDFLVIDESAVPADSERLIYVEPYDSSSVIVKPQLGQEYYGVHNSAKEFLERERDLEEQVLLSLAQRVEVDRKEIEFCIRSLTELDLSIAKAALAIRYDCVRPVFKEKGVINVKRLRFTPLEESCLSEKKSYTPLTAPFDAHSIVISGSNMGGKTIVLKTLLFAQLLAQMGFYVPAECFETILFQSINLIGDTYDRGDSGLSSYGEEIMSFINSRKRGKTLYIIDEFARTTNSVEAYALNSALLEVFSESPDVWSFSSTHQENLPDFENISFWLMEGLDYEKYGKYFHSDFNSDLADRTALINNFMDYRIKPKTSRSQRSRDALKIADILGLDSRMIKYAEKYIKKQE